MGRPHAYVRCLHDLRRGAVAMMIVSEPSRDIDLVSQSTATRHDDQALQRMFREPLDTRRSVFQKPIQRRSMDA